MRLLHALSIVFVLIAFPAFAQLGVGGGQPIGPVGPTPGCAVVGCTFVFPAGGGITLTEPSSGGSASATINFPASGPAQTQALWQNNVAGTNVLAFRNLNANGYSAINFLGNDGCEHGASGWGNGASEAAAFSFKMYIEGSNAGCNGIGATIGGTSFVSTDTVALTFTNASIAGFPVTVTYTLGGGETAASIANGLVSLVNASAILQAANVVAFNPSSGLAVNGGATISLLQVPPAGTTVATRTITGTGNETVTFAPSGTFIVSGAPPPGINIVATGTVNSSTASVVAKSWFFSPTTAVERSVGFDGVNVLNVNLFPGQNRVGVNRDAQVAFDVDGQIGVDNGQNDNSSDYSTHLYNGFYYSTPGPATFERFVWHGNRKMDQQIAKISTIYFWQFVDTDGSSTLPLQMALDGSGRAIVGNLVSSGYGMIGSSTSLTLSSGEFGFSKISASGSAPGAGGAKMEWVAGTSGGTCKLISYAGTSTTPTTIVDNVGGSC